MTHVLMTAIGHVSEKFNFDLCVVVIIAKLCAADSALVPGHEVVFIVPSGFRFVYRDKLESSSFLVDDKEIQMRRLTFEGSFRTKQANL